VAVDRWREAWRRFERPAFDRDSVHDDLVAFHADVLGAAERVLVPLSGRSLDLAWLAERGHEVVGVEIVEEVVAAYFADGGLEVAPTPAGPFRAYRAARLTVLAGDMLDARPELTGTFDGAWDRAALVALPPSERPAYAAVLRRLMRPGSRMLLQTFDLDRPPDTGPPYRVAQEELARLYPAARLRVIGERAATPQGWAAVTYRLDLP
jgi:thiopurine S-methyltransferase